MNTTTITCNTSLPQRSIKEMLAGDKTVCFTHYVKGELWYATECGFAFPVPISDVGEATFPAKDRAMLYMRYVRKEIDRLKAEQEMIEQARQEHENSLSAQAAA